MSVSMKSVVSFPVGVPVPVSVRVFVSFSVPASVNVSYSVNVSVPDRFSVPVSVSLSVSKSVVPCPMFLVLYPLCPVPSGSQSRVQVGILLWFFLRTSLAMDDFQRLFIARKINEQIVK
jgi:hypothetical protein